MKGPVNLFNPLTETLGAFALQRLSRTAGLDNYQGWSFATATVWLGSLLTRQGNSIDNINGLVRDGANLAMQMGALSPLAGHAIQFGSEEASETAYRNQNGTPVGTLGLEAVGRDSLSHLMESTAMSHLIETGKTPSEACTDAEIVRRAFDSMKGVIEDAAAPIRKKVSGSEGEITVAPNPDYEGGGTSPSAKIGIAALDTLLQTRWWR